MSNQITNMTRNLKLFSCLAMESASVLHFGSFVFSETAINASYMLPIYTINSAFPPCFREWFYCKIFNETFQNLPPLC